LKNSSRESFVDRHIGPDATQIETMLAQLGESDLTEFIAKVVPENITLRDNLANSLPTAISEVEAIQELRAFANQNKVMKSLIGLGYYGTITPPVILRNVLENPA